MSELQRSDFNTNIGAASSPTRRLFTAGILGSLTAFDPLSIDMYLPSLPKISADLHASTSMTQLTGF